MGKLIQALDDSIYLICKQHIWARPTHIDMGIHCFMNLMDECDSYMLHVIRNSAEDDGVHKYDGIPIHINSKMTGYRIHSNRYGNLTIVGCRDT